MLWLLLFVGGALAEENKTVEAVPAAVLARKYIAQDALVVEGIELVMTYEVYNIGTEESATNVVVSDTIDEEIFEIVDGESSARIAELGPLGRHSYNVTVSPKVSGSRVVPRAAVSYSVGGSQKKMISSSPGRLEITSAGAYLRATSYYLKEWFVFAVATLAAPVAIPAHYYFTHK